MEELLREVLKEVRNLSYLFFGYAIIWIFLFGYVYSLSRRERELRNEIERLRQREDLNVTDE